MVPRYLVVGGAHLAFPQQLTIPRGGGGGQAGDWPPYPALQREAGSGLWVDPPSSVSFEGCGAALTYHLGVLQSMFDVYGRRKLEGVKWIGTSSGAIAALIAAMGLNPCEWKDRLVERWGGLQDRCGGLLNADGAVGELIADVLATDSKAFERLTGRLHVSVTECLMSNALVSTWHSNEHVCRVVLASCFIPLAFLRPVLQRGCFIIDGGFSHNHPKIDAHTVLVSPTRTVGSHIMPQSKARFRDIIGAPKVGRSNELFDDGVYNGTCFFAPSRAFGLVHHEGVPQSGFGRLYYSCIKHELCMFLRVMAFWNLLLLQVLCLPLCCIFSCPDVDAAPNLPEGHV